MHHRLRAIIPAADLLTSVHVLCVPVRVVLENCKDALSAPQADSSPELAADTRRRPLQLAPGLRFDPGFGSLVSALALAQTLTRPRLNVSCRRKRHGQALQWGMLRSWSLLRWGSSDGRRLHLLSGRQWCAHMSLASVREDFQRGPKCGTSDTSSCCPGGRSLWRARQRLQRPVLPGRRPVRPRRAARRSLRRRQPVRLLPPPAGRPPAAAPVRRTVLPVRGSLPRTVQLRQRRRRMARRLRQAL